MRFRLIGTFTLDLVNSNDQGKDHPHESVFEYLINGDRWEKGYYGHQIESIIYSFDLYIYISPKSKVKIRYFSGNRPITCAASVVELHLFITFI